MLCPGLGPLRGSLMILELSGKDAVMIACKARKSYHRPLSTGHGQLKNWSPCENLVVMRRVVTESPERNQKPAQDDPALYGMASQGKRSPQGRSETIIRPRFPKKNRQDEI